MAWINVNQNKIFWISKTNAICNLINWDLCVHFTSIKVIKYWLWLQGRDVSAFTPWVQELNSYHLVCSISVSDPKFFPEVLSCLQIIHFQYTWMVYVCNILRQFFNDYTEVAPALFVQYPKRWSLWSIQLFFSMTGHVNCQYMMSV